MLFLPWEWREGRLPLQIVAFFSVLAEIQTLDFVGQTDANASHHIDDLQQDERAHDRDAPRDSAGNNLIQNLTGVAVDPTHRHAAAKVVYLFRREHARQDRAQRSAD